MSLLLLLLFVGCVFGTPRRTVKVTVSNCTKETDEASIQILGVTPYKQEIGQNFTIFGKGIPKVNILNGIFNASAHWVGIPVYSVTGNACEPDKIVLPLDVGEIYYGGTPCPINANEEYTVNIGGIVHPDAIDVTVHIRLTVTDIYTQDEIFCVLTDIDIGTL